MEEEDEGEKEKHPKTEEKLSIERERKSVAPKPLENEQKIKGKIYIIDPKEKFIILEVSNVLPILKNMLGYEKILKSTTKLLKFKNNH